MNHYNQAWLSHDQRELSDTEISQREASGIKKIKSLKTGLGISFIAVLGSISIIIGLIFYSSAKFDQYADHKMIELIDNLIRVDLEKHAALALDYSYWNEAIEKVIYQRDMAWADEHANGYLQKTYQLDWVLTLSVDGELIHGKHGEETLETMPVELMTPGLQELVDKVSQTDFSDPKPASGIINIGGIAGLAGVSSYVPYEPTEYDTDQSHGVLIIIKKLDQELLSTWEENYQTGELSFISANIQQSDTSADEYHSTPVITAEGESAGIIRWTSENPSENFLGRLGPWVLAAGSIIFLYSILFYIKLRRYSQIATNHFSELTFNRQQLLKLANHDFLTGLANRSSFVEHITREIALCIRHDRKSAVIYIDLDGFKSVNDSLGHSVGDDLLARVGATLNTSVRKEDVVARFGGDEFCILLSNISGTSDIQPVVEMIHNHFSKPITINNMRLNIGASIGIIIIPDDTTDCSNVFRLADIAMYKAKARGVNRHCYYTGEMETQHKREAKVKSLLLDAIEKQELYLNYQPLYALNDHAITGFEALARWQNEDLGQVSPAEFIPIAEASETIIRLGYWIFDQALNDLVKINKDTKADFTISINISVKQLREKDFLSRIEKIRQNHGVDSDRIFLEITESLLINDKEHEYVVLQELTENGYHLVLDDFGTGYSALSYLQRYPLDIIKIDKSFVDDCMSSNNFLIKTIVYMSKMAGMRTVAEGIETQEQENFLCSVGCTYGQGFYFSRPAGVDAIISLVKTRQCPLPS